MGGVGVCPAQAGLGVAAVGYRAGKEVAFVVVAEGGAGFSIDDLCGHRQCGMPLVHRALLLCPASSADDLGG